MKKNVVAEGEELRVNDRLIPSKLRVLDFYITPSFCPFSDLEKKTQSPQA